MLARSARGDSWLVKCDGCGKETLAEVFQDRLVIYDRRHGQRHVAVVTRCELLKILGRCMVTCVPEDLINIPKEESAIRTPE